MMVTVRLFASLREALGASALQRDLPAGATIRDLVDSLEREFPRLADSGRYALARNEEYATGEELLADGDEVALIPPVSGGLGACGGSASAARRHPR